MFLLKHTGSDCTLVFGMDRLRACLIANCVLPETYGLRSCLGIWNTFIKSLFDSYAYVLVWHLELD